MLGEGMINAEDCSLAVPFLMPPFTDIPFAFHVLTYPFTPFPPWWGFGGTGH